jgi:Tyrosine-protein kinase ephrin type A/B receptor-like
MSTNCPAGYYCPSGTSSSQHDCPKAHYCPSKSKHPTPCPKGYYCPYRSSTPTECGRGNYCPVLSWRPTPCSPGTYCPGTTSSFQTPCPGNTYSTAGSSACSCVDPSNGRSSGTAPNCTVVCNPGFEMFEGQCYASTRPSIPKYLTASGDVSMTATNYITYVCPPCYSVNKTFCNFSKTCTPTCPAGYIVDKDSKCSPCAPGLQSMNNRCVPADAGYFSFLGTEMACPAGTWAAAGAKQCTLCPVGTYSSLVGATSSSNCNPCPVGTWSSTLGATTCTPCSLGTFSTTTGRTTQCTNICGTCPSGKYISKACTAWSNTACSSCSNPGNNQYVTIACASNMNTQMTTFPSCTSGNFLYGSSQGSYTTAGSPGRCLACIRPTAGTGEYVTTACGTYSNSVISTQTCSTSQYISGLNQGTYSSVGSQGTCTACGTPTVGTLQYVSNICKTTSNTVILTANVCTLANQFRDGFSQGSAFVLGSTGTCRDCGNPVAGTTQYVSTVCGPTSNTIISSRTCAANEYALGFSQGTYSSLGSQGTCTSCGNPGLGQYVTAVCTTTSNTVVANKTCSTGTYLSTPGTYQTVGSATCSPCNTSGLSNCATCPNTTPYWNGTVCKNCIVNANCAIGQYCLNGTCTNCNTNTTCPTCPAETPKWKGVKCDV